MSPARLLGASVLLALTATPALAQDATAGAALFRQRCGACHVVAAGARPTIAPNLFGVGGRRAGSTTFNYSTALKGSNLSWDRATLDRFLSGPMKLVPGTRMVVSIPDARQRADVVAYLMSLK